MVDTRRTTLQAVLRQDFSAFSAKAFATLNPNTLFVAGWPLDAIAYQLDQVRRGHCKRLIVNAPPRSLKSLMMSVFWPAFLLGHDPTIQVVCASYSQELARKHSMSFRTLVGAEWYLELFPGTRIGNLKNTQDEIQFTALGSRYATSVGGTMTGRGGDIIIIDDPLKASDANSPALRSASNEWVRTTLMSRLDDKVHGAIVVGMQRVHMDDFTGHLLESGNAWTLLTLPAIATHDESVPLLGGKVYHRRTGDLLSPEREPLEILTAMRREMGSDVFSAQYQQSPIPPGGMMIKRHWIKRFTEEPPGYDRIRILQSWDTALKGGPDNDWSVCTTWIQTIDTRMYLLDVWRARVGYPALKAQVVEQAKKWNATQVLVEEAGAAISLLQELEYAVPGLVGIKPKPLGDKVARMAAATSSFEAGQVFFPARADWLPDLEAELFAFPGSRYDDQVDSISQAVLYCRNDSMAVWAKLAGRRTY